MVQFVLYILQARCDWYSFPYRWEREDPGKWYCDVTRQGHYSGGKYLIYTHTHASRNYLGGGGTQEFVLRVALGQ